jgi:LAS superfamily LD-carboxypeptidase LdcB
MLTVTPEILTGRTQNHLVKSEEFGVWLHAKMEAPFKHLHERAKRAGFDLRIVSSFRDFETQKRIWDEKALGKRPLLDSQGVLLDHTKLSPDEILSAIIRWSAVPGASRHHWGTDIDVYDAKALPEGYKIQLTPSEVNEGGIFAPLHDWLDHYMWEEGFFRPYEEDRGGVSPERWHLSYAPISQPYLNRFSESILRESLASVPLELKSTLESRLSEVFEKYVKNICPPVW